MAAFKQCEIGASVAFRIDVHADIPRAKDAVEMPTVAQASIPPSVPEEGAGKSPCLDTPARKRNQSVASKAGPPKKAKGAASTMQKTLPWSQASADVGAAPSIKGAATHVEEVQMPKKEDMT
eukprot:2460503-Lingulodinium_polyedra.AAC.1